MFQRRKKNRQRVVLVTRGDVFPPNHGAAVKIVRTAEAMTRLGADVWLVSNDPARYVRILDRGCEEVAYPKKIATKYTPNEKRLKEIMRRLEIPDADAFMYMPTFDPHFWLRASYVVHKIKADAVQAEFPGYAIPATIAAAARRGCRTTLAEHNVEYLRIADSSQISETAQRNLKALEMLACAAVQDVIVCSKPDGKRLADAGISSNRIHFIPHGVDIENYDNLDKAAARKRLGIPTDAFVIVYHGVLHYGPNKEAVEIIVDEIMPRMKARGVEAFFLCVGGNPPRQNAGGFDALFTGAVESMPQVLSAADAAVVPLLGGGGTRLKILEYFAAKLPCVSTAKGAEGIPIKDGAEILIRDDWDSMADAVAELKNNRRRTEEIASAAYRFVQGYSWTSIAQQHLELYQKPAPPFYRRGLSVKTILQALRDLIASA